MACRAATARYYGTWAAEGLCRECILAMSPEIRIKVLRDMHPQDRKRWQLDDLYTRGAAPERRATRPGADPQEEAISRLLEATESGSESAFEAEAARAGVKIVPGQKTPSKT